MASGIYCIRNTADGKRYIGRTVDLHKREVTHFWALKNNRHNNNHMQRAYNKNPNALVFEPIELCEKDKLNEREIYWIAYYNTMDDRFGYNQCEGGKTTTGYHFSEETKKKMSEKRKGVKYSKEVIEKRKRSLEEHMKRDPEFAKHVRESRLTSEKLIGKSTWNKGRHCPEWLKKANSERMMGRPITEEHKEKLRKLYSGEGSLSAKLTQSEVIEMRLRFLNGEPRLSIAKDFPNMHPNTIYDIVKGKRWKHIPNSIEELERLKNGTEVSTVTQH